ncbi:MAG: hypothetical protein WDO13_03700 [Verrucomicrobiota bacterium]
MDNRLSENALEALARDVRKLRRDAAQVVLDIRDHAGARVDDTRRRLSDSLTGARRVLTSRPLYFFGLGFAVGLALGLCLTGPARQA